MRCSPLVAASLVGSLALTGCKDDKYQEILKTPSRAPSSSVEDKPPTESPFVAAAPSATASADREPEWVIVQHVLVAYKGVKRGKAGITRTKEEAKARAEEVRKKALDGVDFTELVKDYSDDPAALERLGSTGKFKRGDMDKKFSDASFALRVGEISPVVETPFGFHVIKRNQ